MANLDIKKDEYILKIIHDLENPILAQIKALESFLNTAANKISSEEKELIELTLCSCNYMYKLAEVFNSVYKLNFEPLRLNYEKFDIVELTKNSINELEILLKYHELKIKFSCENKIIINADKFQIKRVIEGFLSNSVNFAFKNSTIEVNLFKHNKKACLEIKNNSPYIEPDILKEIFNKYKIQALYNKNGIGLGIYLAKEIINSHNGEIIVKSFQDNINIFGFILPLS